VSATTNQREVDVVSAVHGPGADTGVRHGAELVAFVDAVMGDDPTERERARGALRAALSPAAFVDACAVVGVFNVVDRIADATGIPLDGGMAALSRDVRRELDLGRFASAANSPGAA
jgi:hypothetical protein